MSDRYMNLRMNNIIQNNARAVIAYGILSRLKGCYNCYIPSNSKYECDAYEEIDDEIKQALEHINKALSKADDLKQYYSKELNISAETAGF